MLLKIIIFVSIISISILVPLYISYKGRGWLAKYDSPPYSFNDIPDLSGKVALVTGINTGIGYYTMRELIRKGAYVIGSVRSVDKIKSTQSRLLTELGSDKYADFIDIEVMDLSSLYSIYTFSKQIKAKNKLLDIVILNAGLVTSTYNETVDGYEAMIGVNYLGHFYLTQLVQTLFNTYTGCRLVHVSSIAHNHPYPPYGIDFDMFQNNSNGFNAYYAYGQSKLANILFSNELARQYKGTKITSNALHPGAIVTELGRNIYIPYDDIFRPYLMTASRVVLMDTPDGALTQLYVATSPQIEAISGKYYEPIGKLLTPSIRAQNHTLQLQLWEYSTKLIEKFTNSLPNEISDHTECKLSDDQCIVEKQIENDIDTLISTETDCTFIESSESEEFIQEFGDKKEELHKDESYHPINDA